MAGIALVWFSAVMFIHMGLGEAVERTLHIRFVLLHCVKCLSFWTTLAYSLLVVKLPCEAATALSFALSYASLWADLALAKLSIVYEDLYQSVAAETQADSADD